MKLICYATGPVAPLLRPAPATRPWMDDTPEAFAYRCLLLNIANGYGWEILCPVGFTAAWTGGVEPGAILLSSPDGPSPAVSHFGSGILTFPISALFRTEPGWDLLLTGPLNRPKDAIAPLAGVVETDWSPYSFTMNWRFTAADTDVHFAAGEPFCTLIPVPRRAMEQVQPEIRSLDDAPDLAARHRAWAESRLRFNADLGRVESEARREKWQKAYYLGRDVDGKPGAAEHVSKVRLAPFADRRRPSGGESC